MKKLSPKQPKDALKPLGEEYLAVVNEAFENRWIDVVENKGKTQWRLFIWRVRHITLYFDELE